MVMNELRKQHSTIDKKEIAKFAELSSHWWDLEGPLKSLHVLNPTRLAFIKKYVDLKGKNIIDLGCGGGILTESLAQNGGLLTGIDAEETAIKVAKEHAKKNKLEINYLCSPIEDYNGPSVDIITCMEMLEHVPSPKLILNHCARLLKPKGLLFLATINRTAKAYALAVVAAEYILGVLPKQTHDFNKFIKPSELANMARNAGLEFLSLSGMTYNPFTNNATFDENVDVNYLMVCKKPSIPISNNHS